MIETLLVVILLAVVFSGVFLLAVFVRQQALSRRVARLESVMEQAVGPDLAQRLRDGGTAFLIPDREWIEDETYS